MCDAPPAREPVLIAVTGDGPGLGKSTLVRLLHGALSSRFEVELFREEDILTDPSFDTVMAEFRRTGEASIDALISGASRFSQSVRTRRPVVVVLDSLLPYLPSLFAWGLTDTEIADFFATLASALEPTRLIQLHLAGDVREGLQRASRREGGDWLERQIVKTNSYRGSGQVSSAQDLVGYLEAGAQRARVLLRNAPWPVEEIDAFDGLTDPLPSALSALDRLAIDPPH